jgi:hypothetical protein
MDQDSQKHGETGEARSAGQLPVALNDLELASPSPLFICARPDPTVFPQSSRHSGLAVGSMAHFRIAEWVQNVMNLNLAFSNL